MVAEGSKTEAAVMTPEAEEGAEKAEPATLPPSAAATGKSGLVLLTAGGTGGHMFPAAALAAALVERGHRVGLVTDRRGQGFESFFEGRLQEVPTYRLDAASPSGGLKGKIKGGVSLLRGYFQARALVRQLRPQAVVGFGGYASVPLLFAARGIGCPVVVHEQNAVLGRANRLLAKKATVIATTFPETSAVPASCQAKLELVGNPVRPAISVQRKLPFPSWHPIDCDDEENEGPWWEELQDIRLRLLVIGGSQGARVFSDVVPAALALLAPEEQHGIALEQQVRPEDMDRVREAYGLAPMAKAGDPAPGSLGRPVRAFGGGGPLVELSSFFNDIPERLALAHLLICRAGASTIAEMTAVGRPAILVPYPYALDDHQTANAAQLALAQGAWLMPEPGRSLPAGTMAKALVTNNFSAEALAIRLQSLLRDPRGLPNAALAAREFGRPQAAAAEALADLTLRVMTGAGRSPTAEGGS